MKDLKNILFEKLVINKNTKVKKELSESEVDDLIEKYKARINPTLLSKDLLFKTPQSEHTNRQKMEYYMDKDSKPERLVATIKNKEKLIKRWDAAMDLGWVEAASIFRDEIVKRGYYTYEELMAYIVHRVEVNREKYKVFLQ